MFSDAYTMAERDTRLSKFQLRAVLAVGDVFRYLYFLHLTSNSLPIPYASG